MKRYVLLTVLLLILVSCSALKKSEKTEDLMDTYVTITVYSDADASQAIDKAFDEIKRVENLLSEYKNDSQLAELNSQGYLANPDAELVNMLDRSIYYGNLTDGSFDISVKPILDIYSTSFATYGEPPNDQQIKKALSFVDYSKIRINKENDVIVLPDGMGLTLGGIAKGYAIDRAIEVLKEEGIEHALVNAGGDMRAIGNKGEENWEIALQNPRDKNDYITIIPLNNLSVATSGDYERYFDENMTFHHIVDPKTGYSATELISVTIIADDAIDADALATSVFVMGKEKGMELIESLDGVEGLIITNKREIFKSSGFDQLL